MNMIKDINFSMSIMIVGVLISILITDSYLVAIKAIGVLLFVGLLIIANEIKERENVINNNINFQNKTGNDLTVEKAEEVTK